MLLVSIYALLITQFVVPSYVKLIIEFAFHNNEPLGFVIGFASVLPTFSVTPVDIVFAVVNNICTVTPVASELNPSNNATFAASVAIVLLAPNNVEPIACVFAPIFTYPI